MTLGGAAFATGGEAGDVGAGCCGVIANCPSPGRRASDNRATASLDKGGMAEAGGIGTGFGTTVTGGGAPTIFGIVGSATTLDSARAGSGAS